MKILCKKLSLCFLVAILSFNSISAEDANYNMPNSDVWNVQYDPLVETKMEKFATDEEIRSFIEKHSRPDMVVFTEDRLNSIRRDDAIPAHWLTDSEIRTGQFTGQAQPYEFYVFQLAVYPASKDLSSLDVSFQDLKGPTSHAIAAKAFRCINLGGIGQRSYAR